MASKKPDEHYSEQQTIERADAALKRMLFDAASAASAAAQEGGERRYRHQRTRRQIANVSAQHATAITASTRHVASGQATVGSKMAA
jgi:hypothetical protein